MADAMLRDLEWIREIEDRGSAEGEGEVEDYLSRHV